MNGAGQRYGRRDREHGFSLVEVILALGLLGSVLIAVAGLFVLGNRQVRSGRTHSTALAVARDVLEEMNGWRFDRTYSGFELDGSAAAYTIDTRAAGYASKWQPLLAANLQDSYAEIVLQSVDAAGGTTPLEAARAIRIEVTVFWNEGPRMRQVSLAMVRM